MPIVQVFLFSKSVSGFKKAQHFTNFKQESCEEPNIFLTILRSESLLRVNVVQVLWVSISKSAPTLPSVKDFDFESGVSPQSGANFGNNSRFSKLTFPAFGTQNQRQFHAICSCQNCLTSHICVSTPAGNSQHSRKLGGS